MPPLKKAPPKKITQSSKESPKAGSSKDGDSVSAGKSNTLGRKQKSTTKLPPPQSQPLDLSFDDSEGNSQSILNGASKSYFQKTTPVSKQPKTTEPASTDVNPEDEDEELIPPSQNTTKRRTHFPLSLAGLDKDGNTESSPIQHGGQTILSHDPKINQYGGPNLLRETYIKGALC